MKPTEQLVVRHNACLIDCHGIRSTLVVACEPGPNDGLGTLTSFTRGGAVSSKASEVTSPCVCTRSRLHCSAESVSSATFGAFNSKLKKFLRVATVKWSGT